MQLSSTSDRFYVGENKTRCIVATVDEETQHDICRIAFVTPSGKTFLSDALDFVNGKASFYIPSVLLDCEGKLIAQLIAYKDETVKAKSRCYIFDVFPSVDEDKAEGFCDDNLMSYDRLCYLVDSKADYDHLHDDRYYKKELIADRVISQGKSGIWTYRIWASGHKECWGTYAFGPVSTSGTWGGYNKSEDISVYFNDGFFADVPVVTFSVNTTDFPGHVYYHQSSNPNKVGTFNLACHNEKTVSGSIHIHAIGV